MNDPMSLELLAYRALVKLGYTGGHMVSFERFERALEKVSLYDGRTMRDGPKSRAALAIHSFGNVNRGDYGDTYKTAATVIAMDAMGEPWESRMEDGAPSADDAAEVLERMLFDAALNLGEDWEKEDEKDRAASASEETRRLRNARRRERRLELKQLAVAAASTTPMPGSSPPRLS